MSGGVASAADAVEAACAPPHIPLSPMERMETSLGLSSWVVPIYAGHELEQCMVAMVTYIDSKEPEDDSVRRLLNQGFRVSWERLLDDPAVANWNSSVKVRAECGCSAHRLDVTASFPFTPGPLPSYPCRSWQPPVADQHSLPVVYQDYDLHREDYRRP